jgi:hypothetical protein
MSTPLDFGGVVAQLCAWVHERVGVVVAHEAARGYAAALAGVLNRAEGAKPGSAAVGKIIYFSVGADMLGERNFFRLDEAEFTSAELAETTHLSADGIARPTITVTSGAMILWVGLLTERPGTPKCSADHFGGARRP